ncbi:MAG: hypothetical protein GY953_40810, partial [bacterium]|nr:hypothetical protein [bacterium]
IEVEWAPTEPVCGRRLTGSGDYCPFGRSDLLIRLLPTAPACFARQKGIFGAAWIAADKFSTRADIYYDRIEQIVFEKLRSAGSDRFASLLGSDVCMALVLGTVLAHEMGHLLLGTNSHSDDGIMHPKWNRTDLEDSYLGRQRFTRKEAKRLHATLRYCDSS